MNIAIYSTKNNISTETINNIKNYFLSEDYTNMVFLASDIIIDNQTIQNIGIINSIHLNWFKGYVLYTSIKDYMQHKDKTIANPIILLSSKEETKELTTDIINNCELLITNKNKSIRKAKNAELHKFK